MRFLSTLAGFCSVAAALPLARRATSGKFGLMTIHSASPIHYSSLSTLNSDGTVYVGGSGDAITFVITDGELKVWVTDGLESVVYVDPSTFEVKYRATAPADVVTKTWTIDAAANEVVLNDVENAYACAYSDGYKLYYALGDALPKCPDGADAIGAVLYYVPDTSSSSVATVAATSSVVSSTSSAAASATATSGASKPFGIVSVHSGSAIQYLGFSTNGDGLIYFGGDSDITTYVEDGYLKIYGSNEYIFVDDSTGQLKYAKTIPSSGVTSKVWSLSETSVLLDGKASAIACSASGGAYEAYWVLGDDYELCSDGSEGIGADLYYTFVAVSSSAASTPAKTTSVAPSSTKPATSLVTVTTTAAGEDVVVTVTCSTTAVPEASSASKASKASKASAASASGATASVLPPNLLIPAKEAAPDTVFGAQYTGTVITSDGADTTTFVSFDVPPLAGSVSSCKLTWTVPSAGSFPFAITGTKKVAVYGVSGIDESTLSWSKKPSRGALVGEFDASTGAFTNAVVPCEFGKKQQFELVADGNAEVSWFQEWEPLTGFNYVLLA